MMTCVVVPGAAPECTFGTLADLISEIFRFVFTFLGFR